MRVFDFTSKCNTCGITDVTRIIVQVGFEYTWYRGICSDKGCAMYPHDDLDYYLTPEQAKLEIIKHKL